MSKFKKLLVVLAIVLGSFSLVYSIIKFLDKNPFKENICKQNVEYYLYQEYKGQVIEKFIDRNDHMEKKIVILENNIEKKLFMTTDTNGVFEFISVDDTLEKYRGDLSVKVSNANLDTVLHFKFLCY